MDHLTQSLRVLFATRRATRVERPAVGSELPALVDTALNAWGIAAIQAAAIDALRQEPRIIETKSAVVSSVDAGEVVVDLDLIVNIAGVISRTQLQVSA